VPDAVSPLRTLSLARDRGWVNPSFGEALAACYPLGSRPAHLSQCGVTSLPLNPKETRMQIAALLLRTTGRLVRGSTLVLPLLVGSCAAGSAPARDPAESGQLPEFTAAEASLFDDTIALSVFGAELTEVKDAENAKLSERTVRADAVVPVKVSTVTSESVGDTERYQLVVTPWAPSLAGAAQADPITLEVSWGSPSFQFVKSADITLVGTRLILFFKRYDQDGRASVHWRLEADSNEVRKVVEEARPAANELGT
jgi:hypothetical protein